MRTVRLTDRGDVYTTQDGDREVFALGGNDRVTVEGVFDDGNHTFIDVYGGPGNDRILGRVGLDDQIFFGGPGSDYVEVGSGVEYSYAYGGSGNDVLKSLGGGGQAVVLRGEVGNDTLHGAARAGEYTTFEGGPGRDLLVGGLGNDEFALFFTRASAAPDRDVVRNFQDGRDKIETRINSADRGLPGDADATTPGDQDFAFVGRTTAVDAGEIGFFTRGADTIVVADDGAQTVELELDRFRGTLDAGDFLLNDFFA